MSNWLGLPGEGSAKRIRELEAKIEALEAELDRAANEIHRLGMKCSVQEDELQALRSALERITRTYGSAGAVNIAREALLEGK